jgi:hypothetical protein
MLFYVCHLQLALRGVNVDGEDAGTINDPQMLMEVSCSLNSMTKSCLSKKGVDCT